MRHRVDFECLFNQRIWRVHKFLSCHNPGIVHQNADVPCLSLHLHGEETVIQRQMARKKLIYNAHVMKSHPQSKKD